MNGHRARADQPWERKSESAPSLRCSRRNINGQGLSSGTPGTFNLQRQKAKTHFVATRLLRHVEPIEAAPHSNNQVNTGMTTQVNTGAVLRSGNLQMSAPCPRGGDHASRFMPSCEGPPMGWSLFSVWGRS